MFFFFFFFNDTATTEIYTLSLHDGSSDLALIDVRGESGETTGREPVRPGDVAVLVRRNADAELVRDALDEHGVPAVLKDRKSTRLNSSHANISYAVFCLKKKKKYTNTNTP